MCDRSSKHPKANLVEFFRIAKVAKNNFSKKLGKSKFNEERIVANLYELIADFIKTATGEGNTGCYVPLRAIPYLSILGIRKIFVFDDDPGIHNKYFDGFPVAVESLNDLIEEPVSHMLIEFFFWKKNQRKSPTTYSFYCY